MSEVIRQWDSYVKEASVPDFVIQNGDDMIRISNPTGVQLLRISQGMRRGDAELMLMGLTGDAYEEVMKLLANVGHQAVGKLTEDLMEYFQFYEEVTLIGPGGGQIKATRPTEIQKLLNLGYTPRGEARASSN